MISYGLLSGIACIERAMHLVGVCDLASGGSGSWTLLVMELAL